MSLHATGIHITTSIILWQYYTSLKCASHSVHQSETKCACVALLIHTVKYIFEQQINNTTLLYSTYALTILMLSNCPGDIHDIVFTGTIALTY